MNLRSLVLKALSLAPGVTNPLWRFYHSLRRFDGRNVYQVPEDRAAAFAEIWRSNLWGSDDSRSGGGSTLSTTRYVRARLPGLLAKLDARTFLDAPCGDFHWMREVDLGATHYLGADIVPEMIAENQARYGATNRRFETLDIVAGPVPYADLWMCREVLMHIPTADALAVLRNFLASGSRYFLATSFDTTRQNDDLPSAGFRPLNLRLAPVSLPRPLLQFDDFVAPARPRIMGLWSRVQIADALG